MPFGIAIGALAGGATVAGAVAQHWVMAPQLLPQPVLQQRLLLKRPVRQQLLAWQQLLVPQVEAWQQLFCRQQVVGWQQLVGWQQVVCWQQLVVCVQQLLTCWLQQRRHRGAAEASDTIAPTMATQASNPRVRTRNM